MSETTMPVAEVALVGTEGDLNSYELAFHVLPTVTEGEVSGVFSTIKERLAAAGATITSEEAPQRVDLAYEVVKHLEGKNRKFKSANFGWIRFDAESTAAADILSFMEGHTDILRHLLIKLTRQEAQQPFFYHEAMKAAGTVVTNIDEAESAEAVEGEVAETTESADEATDAAADADKQDDNA